jgi:hypothetical protein
MSNPEDKTPYVSVYQPMGGWKPVIYHYNQEDADMPFWEPWATYPYPFATRAGAEMAAMDWAKEEGLRLCPTLMEEK